MSMSTNNLVGLRCHGIFYTSVISHLHSHRVSKGILYLNIYKNRKDDYYLGLSILQTQSVFWWTVKKEEGLIGV